MFASAIWIQNKSTIVQHVVIPDRKLLKKKSLLWLKDRLKTETSPEDITSGCNLILQTRILKQFDPQWNIGS